MVVACVFLTLFGSAKPVFFHSCTPRNFDRGCKLNSHCTLLRPSCLSSWANSAFVGLLGRDTLFSRPPARHSSITDCGKRRFDSRTDARASAIVPTHARTRTHTHPYTYTRIHIGKRLFPLGTFFSFDRLLSSLPWCLPFRIIVVTSAMSSHPHPRHLPTFVTFPSLMFSLLSSLPCSVHFRTFFISLVF